MSKSKNITTETSSAALNKLDINSPQNNIIRLPATIKKTGLSRSTIYALEGRGEFPRKIKLSPRTMGFLESEVDQWLIDRIEARHAVKAG